MKVFGTGLHTDPWKSGIFFRGGDICDPFNGKWFDPPYPTRIWRTYCPLPILPFISIKIGRFGIYFGFKLYGADSEHYLNWMDTKDVYPGSQALCLSVRWTNGS